MTIQQWFEDSCGPEVKFLGYLFFDLDRRLEIRFRWPHKEHYICVTGFVRDDPESLEKAVREIGAAAKKGVKS